MIVPVLFQGVAVRGVSRDRERTRLRQTAAQVHRLQQELRGTGGAQYEGEGSVLADGAQQGGGGAPCKGQGGGK